jgi:hypothetical protein
LADRQDRFRGHLVRQHLLANVFAEARDVRRVGRRSSEDPEQGRTPQMQDLLRGRSLTILKAAVLTLAVALCAGCDQVEVTELVSSHPAPVPGTGTVVTVRIKVHNKSNADLHHVMVDVNIPNVAPLASLFRDYVDIPSGGFAERSYSFVAKIGMDIITGCVDPTNTLGEPEEERANNCRSIDLTLYATQDLDYQMAGRSGATFVDGAPLPGTCARLGQGDAKRALTYGMGQPGVLFVADCPSYGSFLFQLLGTGGKADPEAFRGFTLKNGWKVDSVTLQFRTNRENPNDLHATLEEAQSGEEGSQKVEGFHLSTPPVVGSDNPFTGAHIWVIVGGFLAVYQRVVIKGPAGTDPYGPITEPCFSGYSGGTGIAYSCSGNQDCAPGFTCIGGCCLRD